MTTDPNLTKLLASTLLLDAMAFGPAKATSALFLAAISILAEISKTPEKRTECRKICHETVDRILDDLFKNHPLSQH